MEETKNYCGACVYFCRHYIRRNGTEQKHHYFPICDGHYKYPRVKHRRCDTLACGYHQKKEEPG